MPLVSIAPVVPADALELIAANQASRAYHAPWATPFTDRAGFDEWFGKLDGANVALVARAAGRIIGVINFSQIVLGNFRSAYCGFYGMAGTGGNGLMTGALQLAIDHAFNQLGLHRIEANIQPGNSRSISLVRRAGFRREGYSEKYLRIGGVWRDHERWALLADEPNSA